MIRRLDGLLQGDYRTFFYGIGIDFADLREYQTQDEIRHIDWNVTARMNSPYVRQYVDDREITTWFLLESESVHEFWPGRAPQRVGPNRFCGDVCAIVDTGGNRVGVILYTNRVERTIPPGSGRNQVLRIITRIAARG